MAIIVIEGTDGCGKETQTKLLVEELNKKGIKAYRQSFPNYGSAGAKPVEALLSGELGSDVNSVDAYQSSTFFAVDRLFTYKSDMSMHLKNGENLILDRYVESNLLYQTTKIEDEKESGKFISWLLDFEYNILKLPRPDKIIYLNVPPKISMNLVKHREKKNNLSDDIYENNEKYMYTVYNKGLNIAKMQNFDIINCVDDGGNMRSIEEIHKEILSKVYVVLTKSLEK